MVNNQRPSSIDEAIDLELLEVAKIYSLHRDALPQTIDKTVKTSDGNYDMTIWIDIAGSAVRIHIKAAKKHSFLRMFGGTYRNKLCFVENSIIRQATQEEFAEFE